MTAVELPTLKSIARATYGWDSVSGACKHAQGCEAFSVASENVMKRHESIMLQGAVGHHQVEEVANANDGLPEKLDRLLRESLRAERGRVRRNSAACSRS